MSVTRDDVLRIARLAELHMDEDALEELTEQMSRILGFVSQIGAVPASEQAKPFIPGPDTARLRTDEVRPTPLALGPEDIAPAYKAGFFLVPRLEQFEAGEEADEA